MGRGGKGKGLVCVVKEDGFFLLAQPFRRDRRRTKHNDVLWGGKLTASLACAL